MTKPYETKTRNLVLVLGDQLNQDAAVFDDFDPDSDAVLMTELAEETGPPEHKARLALIFSAARHFQHALEEKNFKVHYSDVEDDNNRGELGREIKRWIHKTRPEKLIMTKPGDFRSERVVKRAAKSVNCELEIRADWHFISSLADFRAHAEGRKSLLLETFYREMRRRHDVLMDGEKPVGGNWNFDKNNRESFGDKRPERIKAPRSFRRDQVTRDVIDMVERRFPNNPGKLDHFDYPVTRTQARAALRDFVAHRLPGFGTYQDAMAAGHPFLYHSRLSCVLNLQLLDPRDAIDAAVNAYRSGAAGINAVEGFVRQILGWREFIRGVYWLKMPRYAKLNVLKADLAMPAFMWTGETEMNCVRQCVSQLIDHAYAHHIQRLMVLGLFAMLLGVRPYDVHRWHMSMYADASDWASLPNVLGMSQYADGGIVGSKPYAASGNYINKMSDYCDQCRYDPKKAAGEKACPFTTLYWDFLSRNRKHIHNNHRMGYQLKNLDRKDASTRRAIRERARALKSEMAGNEYL